MQGRERPDHAHSPLRNTGTLRPSTWRPSMSVWSEPIIQRAGLDLALEHLSDSGDQGEAAIGATSPDRASLHSSSAYQAR